MKKFNFSTFIVCLLTTNTYADFSGKVYSVTDGDTITVISNNQKQIVRLENIDAPETSHPNSSVPTQPYGQASRQFLNNLVYGKVVYVKSNKMDLYKRNIGTVYIGNLNVNLNLVENGLAWYSREYGNDQSYVDAENRAKYRKLGLWNDKNPIYPATWRKYYR